MLMLITGYKSFPFYFVDFNTSHVNVNPLLTVNQWPCIIISIHLMLMLISYKHTGLGKYVPISIHLMLMLIYNLHL